MRYINVLYKKQYKWGKYVTTDLNDFVISMCQSGKYTINRIAKTLNLGRKDTLTILKRFVKS